MNSKINGGGSDFVSGKLHSQAHDVDEVELWCCRGLSKRERS